MALLNTALRFGTHAARPAASSNLEAIYYYETDTGNLFQVQSAAWVQIAITAPGMSNPMTTAGDIITGGTAGAAQRLAKGADSQVLTIDPTTHLPVWATPAGGGGLQTLKGCRVSSSGSISLPSNTLTTLLWDTEAVDTDGFHSTSSNTGRFTVPAGLGGLYMIGLEAYIQSASSAQDCELYLKKNGSTNLVFRKQYLSVATANFALIACELFQLATADYVEWMVYKYSTTGTIEANGPAPLAYFYQIGAP